MLRPAYVNMYAQRVHVCVRACVRAYARACRRASAHLCARACVHLCVRQCTLARVPHAETECSTFGGAAAGHSKEASTCTGGMLWRSLEKLQQERYWL